MSKWQEFLQKIKREHPELKSHRQRLEYARPLWIKAHPKVEPWKYQHSHKNIAQIRKENPKLSYAECVALTEKPKEEEVVEVELVEEKPKEEKKEKKKPEKKREKKETDWQRWVRKTAEKYDSEYLKEHGGLFKVASEERKKAKEKE